MAARIQNTFICSRCEAGVVCDERPTSCPQCKQPFGPQILEGYKIPYSLTSQFQRRVGVEGERPEAYVNSEAAKFSAFITQMPTANMMDLMNDALAIIEAIAGKRSDVSEIRGIVEISKQIGDIAIAYEKYLLAGGKHNYSMLNPPRPEVQPNPHPGARDVSIGARVPENDFPGGIGAQPPPTLP